LARVAHVGVRVVTGVLLLFAAAVFVAVWQGIAAKGWLGADFIVYRDFGAHFLATGDPYLPFTSGVDLPGGARYPPPALFLFVALNFIPWPLWWIIPLGIVAANVRYWRPADWSWPIMAAVLATVPFPAAVACGNSGLWVMAVIAMATRWPAASWFLVAKPNELILTLPFIRHRGWWIGFLIAALASLPLLSYWFDWFTALHSYRGGSPATYSIDAWPLFLLPVLARIASTRYPLRSGRRHAPVQAEAPAPAPTA
jgi:hypothetical protein